MKSKKLLSILCLLALTGCSFNSTSSSQTATSSQATSSSVASSTSSVESTSVSSSETSSSVVSSSSEASSSVESSSSSSSSSSESSSSDSSSSDSSSTTPAVATTIAAALAAEDGTNAVIEGTVTSIDYTWTETNKTSVTISDGEGNSIYLFKLATRVAVGDKVKVTGVVGSHNGSKQIAAGATAEILEAATYAEKTIAAALECEDGALVKVTGKVTSVDYAWSDRNGNMSVTISDDEGNSIYAFRLATKVAEGDKVVVSGAIGSHNGSKQFVTGATAEILPVDKAAIGKFKNYYPYMKVELNNLSAGDELVVGETQRVELLVEYDIGENLDYYAGNINGTPYTLTKSTETSENGFIFYFDFVVPNEVINIFFHYVTETNEDAPVLNFENNDKYTIIGFENGKKYSYGDFFIDLADGYYAKRVYLTSDKAETVELEYNTYNGYYSYALWNFNTTPTSVTLHVEVGVSQLYNITYTGTENLDLESSELPTEAWSGSYVDFFIETKNGYWFEKATIEHSDESVTFEDQDYYEFNIQMPSSDIVVNLSIKENEKLSFATSEYVTDVKFYNDYDEEVTGYKPDSGETIYIVPTVAAGYAVKNITAVCDADNSSVSVYNYDGWYFYYLPEGGVTVSVEVEEALAVTLVSGDNYTIRFSDNSTVNYFTSGSYVRFYVEPNEGYELVSVSCSDSSIVPTETYVSGQYEFRMPTESVSITAEVKAIDYSTVTLGEATGSITSLGIRGYKSYTSLDNAGTDETFIKNETIEFRYESSNNEYTYYLNVTQDGTTTKVELTNYNCYGYGSFKITGEVVEIEVVAVANTKANITLDTPSDLDISFMVNRTTVTDLTNVYVNDDIEYTINSTAEEGYKYIVTLIEGEKETSLSNTSGRITVAGDFTLKVEVVKIESVDFTIVDNTADGVGSKLYIAYTDYTPIEGNQIEKGVEIYISSSSYSIVVTVTIGDTTQVLQTYNSYRLTVTGDVTITIEDAA